MAGLDGVLNKIDPGEPMDKNIYELPPEELAKVPQVPGSLEEALDLLEKDHEFLLKGDVFTTDFLEMWISHQAQRARRPAPAPPSLRVLPLLRRLNRVFGQYELRQAAWICYPRRLFLRLAVAIGDSLNSRTSSAPLPELMLHD